jgi:hypothetical protein
MEEAVLKRDTSSRNTPPLLPRYILNWVWPKERKGNIKQGRGLDPKRQTLMDCIYGGCKDIDRQGVLKDSHVLYKKSAKETDREVKYFNIFFPQAEGK